MSEPSAAAVAQAKQIMLMLMPYWHIDGQPNQFPLAHEIIARALDARATEVWGEAAKIADGVIDPVPSPLTALSSETARFIARMIRARAALAPPAGEGT